jgi:hypothetical protein
MLLSLPNISNEQYQLTSLTFRILFESNYSLVHQILHTVSQSSSIHLHPPKHRYGRRIRNPTTPVPRNLLRSRTSNGPQNPLSPPRPHHHRPLRRPKPQHSPPSETRGSDRSLGSTRHLGHRISRPAKHVGEDNGPQHPCGRRPHRHTCGRSTARRYQPVGAEPPLAQSPE